MNLAILIFIFSAVIYITARPPNKCDIQDLNKKIRNLGHLARRLKYYIEHIKKELTKTNDKFNYYNTSIDTYSKRASDDNKRKHNWFEKHLDRTANSFNLRRKSHAKHLLRLKMRNFSTAGWNITKKIRHVDGLFRKEEIKKTRMIRRGYFSSRHIIPKIVTSFGAMVDNAESKSLNDLKGVENVLYLISRQVQLQQFNEFEKARSDGDSGIKQIKTFKAGEKNFYSNDHNGWSFAGIYDQSHTKQSLGIREFAAVLNGIEFRTKETSYKLEKAAVNDKTFHKLEGVTIPDIPPEVSEKTDHKAQIDEMRAWFKAFQDQDHSERDYRKYFKPVMSYLEGAWVNDNLDVDMAEKLRYTSYTGMSGSNEQIPYLPSTIMGFHDNKTAQYSSWDYRILCNPLQKDFPTNKFQLIYDPVSEQRHEWNYETYSNSGAAKFDIEGLDVHGNRRLPGMERWLYYTLLDELMEEIPGNDNYGGTIMADGFDASIKTAHPLKGGQNLNGAYYHRPYKLTSKDAMGVDSAQRSYSDRLYVALTTQHHISGPKVEMTEGKTKKIQVRASYAAPMEIFYITPLSKWNPFQLPYEEDCEKVIGKGTKSNPFSAACPERHFLTPQSFFTGGDATSCSNSGLSGEDMFYFASPLYPEAVCLRASGIRIVMPRIYGIKPGLRMRYPVMPVNGEGSSVWKKLNAIEDSFGFAETVSSNLVSYNTGQSTKTPHPPPHTHKVVISKTERVRLLSGMIKSLVKPTEPESGQHQHIFTLKKVSGKIKIVSCDSGSNLRGKFCWDEHLNTLIEIQ